ncbi:efflux RND transporter periplasmic adaptor subunit [Acidimangrovimonas pyrenivorans]|uniref:Efflux RND transporter periplasmic adaptor subunit n=1 Tax=Acidimangrovimonas pyrenivorans TaxID=2030798 RepID=A0ABV7ADV1_9RHOB
MSRLISALGRSLAVALPVAAGVLAIAYAGALRGAPETKERSRPPTPVRVVTLAPVPMVPRVSGYGTVAPAREWRAVARVEGAVRETSPLLANGDLAPEGTVLLKIDDTDLRLSLAQTDAQMKALDVKDETLKATLAINSADLELARAELARQQDLQKQGVTTQAALDQARRVVLAARAKVTEVENQLKLNDAERDVLTAQRATAERSLEFTTVTAPYDLRIGTVSAEVGQYVSRGSVLFTAEGTDAAEITAQFPIGRMGPLVRSLGDGKTVLDLKARVRLPAPGHDVTWDASVERVAEAIDARTQSANIILRVDQPQAQAAAGTRPPLRRNMFVSVTLSAPPRPVLAVPAEAVQGGSALVVTPENTLAQKQVTVAYTVDGIAAISGGLEEGDKLVVTDPSVAVPGMQVKPVEDTELAQRIAALAKGQPLPAKDAKPGSKAGKGGSAEE